MIKNFDLATIITILTGERLVPFEKIVNAIYFLTGCEINLSNLNVAPVIFKGSSIYGKGFDELEEKLLIIRPYIFEKYPELVNISISNIFNNDEEVSKYLEEQRLIYGNDFPLEPINQITKKLTK